MWRRCWAYDESLRGLLLLTIATVVLVASGCGASHKASQTTTGASRIVIPVHSQLSRSVRAAIRRFAKVEGQMNHTDAWLGTGGCYLLVRDHRTHKLTAKPRKHC